MKGGHGGTWGGSFLGAVGSRGVLAGLQVHGSGPVAEMPIVTKPLAWSEDTGAEVRGGDIFTTNQKSEWNREVSTCRVGACLELA